MESALVSVIQLYLGAVRGGEFEEELENLPHSEILGCVALADIEGG